jgi:hypothetical protein
VWANRRVRELATSNLDQTAPSGDEQHIELEIGGQTLSLDIAGGFAGLPPFGVSGEFHASKTDLDFGTGHIPKARVRLDATAWITPGPAQPGAQPTAAAGDRAVRQYSFAGGRARFDDTHTDKTHTVRTGAIALWSSVKRLQDELHEDVRDHPALKLTEQKVALLQEMRPFFGSDDRTIDHFKRIRRVFLHTPTKKATCSCMTRRRHALRRSATSCRPGRCRTATSAGRARRTRSARSQASATCTTWAWPSTSTRPRCRT